MENILVFSKSNLLGDKNFIVIGKKDDFITFLGWRKRRYNRSGQWRYRRGDYRLICIIEDKELIILALTVGHRRDVYEK